MCEQVFEELIESQKSQDKKLEATRPQHKKSSSVNSVSSQSDNSSQPVSVKRFQKPPTRVTPPRLPKAAQTRQHRARDALHEQVQPRGRLQSSRSSSRNLTRSNSFLERQLQAKLLDKEFKDLLQQDREDRIDIHDAHLEDEGESEMQHEGDSDGNSQQLDIQVPTFQHPQPFAKIGSAKAHESNTTRAESYLTLHGQKPADAPNIFSFASGASAANHGSQQREHGVGSEPLPPVPAEQSGQLSKKLKELMRMSGSEPVTEEPAPAKPASKAWSSLHDGGSNLPQLEQTEDSTQEHQSLQGADKLRRKEEPQMVARYDFKGELSKDLNLKKGDLVRLIDKKKNGWWLAEVGGRIGFVPSNYLVSREEAV